MDLICPTCRGSLTREGPVARCLSHGGTFQVLYFREPAPAPVAATASPVEADAAPPPPSDPVDSSVPPPIKSPVRLTLAPRAPLPSPPAEVSPRFANMRCVQHPSVTAAAQCCSCGAYVCATCDFALPNNLHVCPACAVASQSGLSPRRKRGLWWSLGLAIWSSVVMAALFAAAVADSMESEAAQAGFGVLLTMLAFVPSVIGFGIGLSTVDRRLANPPLLWVATIWNALIAAGYLLLAMIGAD